MLRCFELASGLKVNFHKSKLTSVAVDQGNLSRLASMLNCKLMTILFVYLGIPGKLQFWEHVISKIKNRLSNLKKEFVSFGGHVCLIQSVLLSLPLFFISFFKCRWMLLRHVLDLCAFFYGEARRWNIKLLG